jgi:tRNA-splicing ligase RtcB
MRFVNNKVKVWDNGVHMETGVFTQTERLSELPFVTGVRLMPDAHVGIGSTVGSVIATKGAIIPATVSVDIPNQSPG